MKMFFSYRSLKIILTVTVLLLIISKAQPQNRYWVFFIDKKDVSFDPYEYFDAKAIERRIKHNIPLSDPTDYPLNKEYKKTVCTIAEQVTSETRWFNAVAVIADNIQIEKINDLPFVKNVREIVLQTFVTTKDYNCDLSDVQLDLAVKQTERMGGNLFKESGIDGTGIRIAIFDGGFPSVDTSPVFEHIRKDGRIIKTRDFAKKKEFVYGYISHGTSVMSCIGGKVDTINMGLATGAEFLLARTEIMNEPFSEEENWLAAVEWADKNGADIINSSLGYTTNRYFSEDMDGKTSLVVKAANMAASKGILVVNANGNEGDGAWEIIGTPADADSVLSVGGIDPGTDYHISFSSFGPTTDKRMKPNVCAYGRTVTAGKKKIKIAYGTSFSSPLVAGFAACALQTNPELTNMELFHEIEKSGHLYPYYDYAHGYGVPQAAYFIEKEAKIISPTFTIEKEERSVKVIVNDDLTDTNNNDEKYYLFYHISDKEGIIKKYAVIKVYKTEVLNLYTAGYEEGDILRIHYKGYTDEYTFRKMTND